jgi:predicted ester cyclase
MSNAQTLVRLFEMMDEQQNAAIREHLAPDCRAIMGGNPPMDGDTWLAMSEMFYAAFPDGRHTIGEVFDADGEHVVLRGAFEGTHTGDFMGIAPTGKRVRVTFLSLDRFADGKLAEHRAELDMLGLMQQLGVVPAMAG